MTLDVHSWTDDPMAHALADLRELPALDTDWAGAAASRARRSRRLGVGLGVGGAACLAGVGAGVAMLLPAGAARAPAASTIAAGTVAPAASPAPKGAAGSATPLSNHIVRTLPAATSDDAPPPEASLTSCFFGTVGTPDCSHVTPPAPHSFERPNVAIRVRTPAGDPTSDKVTFVGVETMGAVSPDIARVQLTNEANGDTKTVATQADPKLGAAFYSIDLDRWASGTLRYVGFDAAGQQVATTTVDVNAQPVLPAVTK